jgi:hypothetical protein
MKLNMPVHYMPVHFAMSDSGEVCSFFGRLDPVNVSTPEPPGQNMVMSINKEEKYILQSAIFRKMNK